MQVLGPKRLNGLTGRVLNGASGVFGSSPLDLRFAQQKTLDPRITFTRASAGTYVAADGLVKTAANNEARFDHNPTTGESLGLLVEEARTNLNPDSSLYQSWVYNMSPSPGPQNNQGLAPDGTNTAWWIPSGSSGVAQANYGIAANTATYSWSIYVKALSSGSQVYFSLNGVLGASTSAPTFDFDTATFSGASNGTVTRLANGWFRLTQTFANNGAGTVFLLRLAADPLTNGRVLFWGSQLEVGAFPSSYIPTSGATGTRAAEIVSATGANFSSWYNSSNTFSTYCEYVSVNRTIGGVYYIGDGADTNRALQLYESTSSSLFEFNTTPTVGFNTTKGTSVKTAFGRVNGNNTGAVNGAIAGTSAGSVSVLPDRLYIGGNAYYPNRYLGSTIKRFTYWPTRLADAALQSITVP